MTVPKCPSRVSSRRNALSSFASERELLDRSRGADAPVAKEDELKDHEVRADLMNGCAEEYPEELRVWSCHLRSNMSGDVWQGLVDLGQDFLVIHDRSPTRYQ
jgi:hypothetical protein